VRLRCGPWEGQVQGWRNKGPGSADWGARLGPDGSPRRGKRTTGETRGRTRRMTTNAETYSIGNGEGPKAVFRLLAVSLANIRSSGGGGEALPGAYGEVTVTLP
jgi:hypothetical protein